MFKARVTIIDKEAPREGVTQSTGKSWVSQNFVLQEAGGAKYPNVFVVNQFGDENIAKLADIPAGAEFDAEFNFRTNKGSKGGYFFSASVWKVSDISGGLAAHADEFAKEALAASGLTRDEFKAVWPFVKAGLNGVSRDDAEALVDALKGFAANIKGYKQQDYWTAWQSAAEAAAGIEGDLPF